MSGSDTVQYTAVCDQDNCDDLAQWRGTKANSNGTNYTITCACQPPRPGFAAVVEANRRKRTEGNAA